MRGLLMSATTMGGTTIKSVIWYFWMYWKYLVTSNRRMMYVGTPARRALLELVLCHEVHLKSNEGTSSCAYLVFVTGPQPI